MSESRDQAKHHLDRKAKARGQSLNAKLDTWECEEQVDIFEYLDEDAPVPKRPGKQQMW